MKISTLSNKEINHEIGLEKLKQENAIKLEQLKLNNALEIEKLKLSKTHEVEELKLLNSVWSKTIETQMHFNEMAAKSRQLGLSFVVAALGLALVLLTKTDTNFAIHIPIPNVLDYFIGGFLGFDFWELIGGRTYETNASFFILFLAAFAVYGVSILDTGVYHKMLRGAVSFGEDLEVHTNFKKSVFDTKYGLTESVSLYSRNENVVKKEDGTYEISNSKTRLSKLLDFFKISEDDKRIAMILKIMSYCGIELGEKRVTALQKIKSFYKFTIRTLIILACVIFYIFGHLS